ncbi:hypothetical protein [Sphingomonas sp. 3-13AW]|uniref:hypothetical protein n=1 Tax=Sphingomonas sp. 3-13AW TaxID=3050450 RepID=UPI003BB65947
MICKTTRPQRLAILRLFKRNPDGSPNYRHFRRRVTRSLDWIGLTIGGIYYGIEEDGYVHT